MPRVESSSTFDTTKYNLSTWSGKKCDFPNHRSDVNTFMVTHKITWIIEAARGLFIKAQALSEVARQANQAFSWDLKDHDEEVLTAALQTRESGRIMARLSVVKMHVLKDTFGSNFTKHKESGFDDEASFKTACEVAVEDYFMNANIVSLKAFRTAANCENGTDPQKDRLRSIVHTAEVKSITEGTRPADIEEWTEKPWLMPSVKAWYNVLRWYEGINETIDSNILADINEIHLSGLGKERDNLANIMTRLEVILAPAPKIFPDVESFCDHLCMCLGVDIIKQLARGDSAQAKAWQLADNSIVSTTRTNCPLTIKIVMNAMNLAHHHLERMEPEQEPTIEKACLFPSTLLHQTWLLSKQVLQLSRSSFCL